MHFMVIFPHLHGLFICSPYHLSMRCDLHVHSTGSGMCNTPGLTRVCKESYNHPAEVYARCKRLGMSMFTITEQDHAEIQRRRNDFIALLMYLTERKLFFSVNHVFSGLTGHRDEEDFN